MKNVINNSFDAVKLCKAQSLKNIIKEYLGQSGKEEDKNLLDTIQSFFSFLGQNLQTILFDLWLRSDFVEFFFSKVTEDDLKTA